MKPLLLLILPFLLLSSLNAMSQATTGDKEKTGKVEAGLTGYIIIEGEAPATIKERMAFFHIKGISLAVIQNYRVVWAKGYGWADDSLKIPVTDQTMFQAGSISKSLHGVGVLKLVQQKKLDLNVDINNYLTSWKFPYDSLSKGKKITIANLLSHTAGLTVHGFPGYERGTERPTVIQVLDGQKPANSMPIRSMYEPGLKSEYSGGGTTISQLIVMDITHQPYTEYMQKEVLQPLGMTNSTYAQPPIGIKSSLLATGYDDQGKEIAGKYHIYPEQAAAGLWTTPTDLAKYIIETQLSYIGKSAKVLNQQTTWLRLTPFIDKTAAMGVFTEDLDSTKYFEHNGANEGFRNAYYGSMENGNGLVVMVNSDNGNIISEIVRSIAQVYGFKGLGKNIVKKVVKVDDALLENYTGKYFLSPTLSTVITRKGNQLYNQTNTQKVFAIYPETAAKFFFKDFPADIEFMRDSAGRVEKFIQNQNGTTYEFKKEK